MSRRLKIVLLGLGVVLVCGAVAFTWILVLVGRQVTAVQQCHTVMSDLARILEKEPDGIPTPSEIEQMLRRLEPDGTLIVQGERGLPVDVWHREFEVRVVGNEQDGTMKLELMVRSAGPDGIMSSGDDIVVERTLTLARSP